MSASDPAPLPRLGEVFFDVRGHARSMRLSWYADTGIAVFSIWQGGRCTGTFRLPIEDLPRMIEILRRGPQGTAPGSAPARDDSGYGEPGHQDAGYPDASDYGGQDGYAQESGYPEDASYSGEAGYSDRDEYPPGAQAQEGPRSGAHRQRGGSGAQPAYEDAASSYATSAYSAGSYGTESYSGRGYDQDNAFEDAFLADEDGAGWSGAHPGDGGEEPEPDRFVPPYVQPGGPAYRNDSAHGPGGYPAGFAGPAYPSDRHADSAPPERYRGEDRFDDDYDDDADDRLTARDPAYPAGRKHGNGGGRRPSPPLDERSGRRPRPPR